MSGKKPFRNSDSCDTKRPPSSPLPPFQDNQIATLSKKLSLMQGNDQSQNKGIIDQKIDDLTSVLEQKKKASNKLTKTLKEFEVSPGGLVGAPDTRQQK